MTILNLTALKHMTYFALLSAILCIGCSSKNKESSCSVGTYSLNQTENKYYSVTPLKGTAQYYATLSIGNPAQLVNMVLDTGSANFVVLGSPSICKDCQTGTYTPGPSAHKQNQRFTLSYSDSSSIIQEYQDTYKLPCDTQNYKESIGVVVSQKGGQTDNILGLAYESAAEPSKNPPPTFLDVLLKQNANLQNMFSLLLCGNRNGSQFVIGQQDTRVAASSLQWTPVIEQKLYTIEPKNMQVVGYVTNNKQWQKQANAVTSIGDFPSYNPKTQIGIPTVMDSGSTRMYLPQEIVENMQAIMQQVVSSNQLNVPSEYWTTSNPNSKDYTYAFTPQQLALFPMVQMVFASTEPGKFITLNFPPERYLQETTPGNRVFSFRLSSDVVSIGQAFMEAYYILFDRVHHQIGFAQSDSLCAADTKSL